MSSDWKQNLYEVGLAGAAALAALLFVAAVIKWEILGTVFLYVMVALLFLAVVLLKVLFVAMVGLM